MESESQVNVLKIDSNVLPKARMYHAMTTDNKSKVYIFGGKGIGYQSTLNELWELSGMIHI